MFDSGWKSFEHRFDAILSRLREHQDLVDREAISFDIHDASNARRKWEEEISQAEEEREQSHRQAALAWLAVDDCEQENHLHELIEKRYGDTCDWLFEHAQFKTWNLGLKKTNLWLHGIPGSGKRP